MSAPLTVAVLAPRAADAARTLASLREQTCTVPWQVLLVAEPPADAGGVEAAPPAAAAALPVPCRLLPVPRWTRGAAVAALARQHLGSCLVLLRAGLECMPGCLERLRSGLDGPGPALAAGRVFPRLPPQAPEGLREALESGLELVDRYDLGLADRVLEPAELAPRPHALLAVRGEALRAHALAGALAALRRAQGLRYCAGAVALRRYTDAELADAALEPSWRLRGREEQEELQDGARAHWVERGRAWIKLRRARARLARAGGGSPETLRLRLRCLLQEGRWLEACAR